MRRMDAMAIERLRQDLEHLGRDVADPRAGFIGPGSMTWRVAGEWITNLGITRAVLMQLAHPKVAQGVADYSSF